MRYCPKCATGLVTRRISGRDRQACPASGCGHVFWHNPTPVVAGLVELDGQVILVRNKGWPETWQGIVAGFLERGETPEAGVLREVHEELGLKGEIVAFIGAYTFEQLNQLILAYHVQTEGEIRLGEEVAEVKRIPPEQLQPWSVGTGPAVRDWLERRWNRRAGSIERG
jgi:NAD+ diphosphatase